MLRSNAVLKPMELDLIAHTNNTNEIRHAGFNNETTLQILHLWHPQYMPIYFHLVSVFFIGSSGEAKASMSKMTHVPVNWNQKLTHKIQRKARRGNEKHPNQKISFIIVQRRERLCQVKLLHDTLIEQLIYKVKKLYLRNKSSDN